MKNLFLKLVSKYMLNNKYNSKMHNKCNNISDNDINI